MLNYKELYINLFAACADAYEALEAMNFGQAKDILLQAQLAAEEKHMDDQTVGKVDYLEKL